MLIFSITNSLNKPIFQNECRYLLKLVCTQDFEQKQRLMEQFKNLHGKKHVLGKMHLHFIMICYLNNLNL